MPVRAPEAGWIGLGLDRELFSSLAACPPVRDAMERIAGGAGHLQLAEKRRQLAVSLRVTASVSPYLEDVLCSVRDLLRLERSVELYVTPSPVANAFCMALPGDDGLLVVVTSGAVELFSREELAFLVGHELGHGLLGHHRLPGSMLLDPVEPSLRLSWEYTLELLRWMRASEISADRFGLVCCQDPRIATRVFLKLASGLSGEYLGRGEDFEDQMEDWARHRIAGEGLDQTHPLLPIRVRCAHAFAESDYFSLLFGEPSGSRGASLEEADRICGEQLARMDADADPIERLDHGEEVMAFLAMAGFLLAASDDQIGAVEYHWFCALVGRDLAEWARRLADECGYEDFCREMFRLGHGISEDLDRRACLGLIEEIGVIAAVDGQVRPSEIQSLGMIGDALRLPSHLMDVALKELGRGNDRRLALRG